MSLISYNQKKTYPWLLLELCIDSQLEIQDDDVELPNLDPLNLPPPPPTSTPTPPRLRLRNRGPAAVLCGVLSALLLCRSSESRNTLVSEPMRGEWYW